MTARVRGAAVVALALGASCAGPPWFMGSPLDGRPSIPPTRKNLSYKGERAAAAAARARGETILELRALLVLDELERLEPDGRERLVTLLERRAAEFRALGRAIPESRDLDRLAHLAPARAAGLLGEHAAAARAAGDAWLAVGAIPEARAAYERAAALGAPDTGFRLAALAGRPPPATTTLAELRAEIAALPLRAVPPLGIAYVSRGGRDRATLARALAAARQQNVESLAARLEDASREAETPGLAGGGADAGTADAGEGAAPDAGAADEAGAGAPGADASPSDAVFDASAPVPLGLDGWMLAGVTVEARLFPLIAAHPEVLDDVERAVTWVDLLLGEDETSPRVLALAAVVFGRAARFGGTERMLMELAYATPDRADGLARGAEIWEQLGRRREACAQWVRAARWRDEPEDPTWHEAIACTRRDPGVGDWREIRSYVLRRARPERRAALSATLASATLDAR